MKEKGCDLIKLIQDDEMYESRVQNKENKKKDAAKTPNNVKQVLIEIPKFKKKVDNNFQT